MEDNELAFVNLMVEHEEWLVNHSHIHIGPHLSLATNKAVNLAWCQIKCSIQCHHLFLLCNSVMMTFLQAGVVVDFTLITTFHRCPFHSLLLSW